MTIDKEKLKALAEAATQSHGPRRVEVDHNGRNVIGDGSWKILSAWHTPDGKGAQNAEFAAAASPATILALLAEIEQLRDSYEQVCGNYNRVSFASEERGEQINQLKTENEALRKDAERYQWLREGGYLHRWTSIHPCDVDRESELTDRAIDMAREASHG